MPLDERCDRHRRLLERIRSHDARYWSARCIRHIEQTERLSDGMTARMSQAIRQLS
jgi:trehalose-6-phosphate synthase